MERTRWSLTSSLVVRLIPAAGINVFIHISGCQKCHLTITYIISLCLHFSRTNNRIHAHHTICTSQNSPHAHWSLHTHYISTHQQGTQHCSLHSFPHTRQPICTMLRPFQIYQLFNGFPNCFFLHRKEIVIINPWCTCAVGLQQSLCVCVFESVCYHTSSYIL